MKKLCIVFLMILSLSVFTSCNMKSTDTSNTIPSHVEWIEFWNGGGMIARYENAEIDIKIVSAKKLYGKDISYYYYEVTSAGRTERIIDSESLAIKFLVK